MLGPNPKPFLSSLSVPSFTFTQCVAEIFTERSKRSAEVRCDEVFLEVLPRLKCLYLVQVTPVK